jgi:hypothetical protein
MVFLISITLNRIKNDNGAKINSKFWVNFSYKNVLNIKKPGC